MTREDLAAWLRLQLVSGVGLTSARKLLAAFGLPHDIFSQSQAALSQVIGERLGSALLAAPAPEHVALLDATWSWLAGAQAGGPMRHVCSLADADYPRSLLTLADPPLLLYATGVGILFEEIAAKSVANDIAIVGSRNATPQGLQNARSFAKSFAQAGAHIVSGLALGIDGAAHEGALDAQMEMGQSAGSTIAIVGTGLDRVYPKRHHDLAHAIVQRGLILSEFPIGTPPLPENFPRRNRLIAALTQGTLVVEATIASGSLITARQALDLGKDVFAIPGSIHNPQSKGCHHLIKQGAKLVESAQDALEELSIPLNAVAVTINSIALHADSMPARGQKDLGNAAPEESALLQALGHDPVSLDALIARTGIPAATLQVQLLEWELAGEVARLPGGLFQRQMSA
jgi:DNA processing protein